MKYFGHQVNASQDMRLKRLRKLTGSMGVDLYWRCLELVGDKLNPKNTTCQLEYSIGEMATEIDSTNEDVLKAFDVMADLGMCHKVPLDATMCHFYFPKIIKYADKAFRNAFPGDKLDQLYEAMCHNVPQCAPKEVKLKEEKFNLKKPKASATTDEHLNGGENQNQIEKLSRQIEDFYLTLDKPNLPEKHRDGIKKQIEVLEDQIDKLKGEAGF